MTTAKWRRRSDDTADAGQPVCGFTGGRRLRYELLGCALHGHRLVGTDAAEFRSADRLFARTDADGGRWHRCLRCDAWLPGEPPRSPSTPTPPERSQIALPLRGKPLRDRYVLRLIALDRVVHFLVLATLAVGVAVFADHRAQISGPFYRVMGAVQNGIGGPSGIGGKGLLGDLSHAFSVSDRTLWLLGLALGAYAVLEGAEAVGLWLGRRWAEYLTFLATALLLLPEIYELSSRVSVLKILTMVINLAIVVYLLLSKRLFGLRGGGRAEQEQHRHDTGWHALERVLPH